MVHLRIVIPPDRSQQVRELLSSLDSVVNVIFLEGVASRPTGDVILCDVAREDASIVVSDLKELDIHKDGSIALEVVDTEISDAAVAAEQHAKGSPADAVVWEEVETNTSENVELSGVFLAFMVLAALLAAVGIYLDLDILIVGAMVVGPEFGPIAGLCVATVTRRPDVAKRSAVALAVGFPLAILATFAGTHLLRLIGLMDDTFVVDEHAISKLVANPDAFSVIVALCAGAAGMLSLSTAKSGALIGVLISVTTILAAANIGMTAAYGDWDATGGSALQLLVNLSAIFVAGLSVLYVQRVLYQRRRIQHLHVESRELAGLPVGRSRRAGGRRSKIGV